MGEWERTKPNEPESDTFIQHLEATSERVRSWPAWKRNMIGPVFPEDRRKEVKPMNLNERAAIEIMGWELLDSDTYKPPQKIKKIGHFLMMDFIGRKDIQDLDDLEEAWQWKPTEDHNHAQIVVNRISEMGLVLNLHTG